MPYLLVALIFGITVINEPFGSGTWYWDAGQALGFAAYAGLLYLFLDTGYARRQRAHQLISYFAIVLVVAHVLWLWVPDGTLWHYAAWNAPAYMLAGLGALALLVVIVVLALPARRRHWHPRYAGFKRWHYLLSVACVILAAWHMTGSGFYLSTLESVLLIASSAAVIWAGQNNRWNLPSASLRSMLALPLVPAAFVTLKAFGA